MSKEKEEALRENWDGVLPTYSREAEDEGPPPNLENKCKISDDESTKGIWDKGQMAQIETDRSSGLSDSNCYMESEDLDDDSEGEVYSEGGEAEYGLETGTVLQKAKRILNSPTQDIKHLSSTKLQIDLSFLSDQSQSDRIRDIIEASISKFSSVSPKMEITKTSEEGVYTFALARDSQPRPSTSKVDDYSKSSKNTVKDIPKKTTKKPQEKRTPIITSHLLTDGHLLVPKCPGLPPRRLKYGVFGLNEESFSQMKSKHPKKSDLDIVLKILEENGQYRSVFNLYKLK